MLSIRIVHLPQPCLSILQHYTKEAVALFYGRKETEELNAIIGLNIFATKIKDTINSIH
jgi:hypothetical protein